VLFIDPAGNGRLVALDLKDSPARVEQRTHWSCDLHQPNVSAIALHATRQFAYLLTRNPNLIQRFVLDPGNSRGYREVCTLRARHSTKSTSHWQIPGEIAAGRDVARLLSNDDGDWWLFPTRQSAIAVLLSSRQDPTADAEAEILIEPLGAAESTAWHKPALSGTWGISTKADGASVLLWELNGLPRRISVRGVQPEFNLEPCVCSAATAIPAGEGSKGAVCWVAAKPDGSSAVLIVAERDGEQLKTRAISFPHALVIPDSNGIPAPPLWNGRSFFVPLINHGASSIADVYLNGKVNPYPIPAPVDPLRLEVVARDTLLFVDGRQPQLVYPFRGHIELQPPYDPGRVGGSRPIARPVWKSDFAVIQCQNHLSYYGIQNQGGDHG
jgi:hypothetical protein